MERKQLYKTNSIYLTEYNSEGRTKTNYIRLIAEDGKAITDGETVTNTVDVLATDIDNWHDCEMEVEE